MRRKLRFVALILLTMGGLIYVGLPYIAQYWPFGRTHWPPQTGKRYPDLQLVDQSGQVVQLSSFRSRVILLETIGMNCPACQAFAGAHQKGAFGQVRPQPDLESIERMFTRFTDGLSLKKETASGRLIFVQLLLFDMNMGEVSAEDARRWARHFGMTRSDNQIVLAAGPPYTSWPYRRLSYDLVPGFQLIDRDFVLRSDSTGHHPKQNLYEDLLPMIPGLLCADE